MTLLIGIDEAGYGPNLGPLCVGATAWKVEDGGESTESVDLYQRLAHVVSPVPDGERIALADSKLLYKPGIGLAQLERGVLPTFALLRQDISGWRALIAPPKLPWYADFDCTLPIDAKLAELTMLTERLANVSETSGVQLVNLRVRMVFPQEFNELTEHYGTKGAALSHVSIGLLRDTMSMLSPSAKTERTWITCDKHGGRNRYAALLQHHFPEESVEFVEESRPMSRYRWGPADSRVEICFRTKGEAKLPVALASMAAKYHRELAMRAFNAFWTAHIPGLKPTAGYPQDAKRFKKEIAAVQSKLGIDDSMLWRTR